jgi:hypothetical protein
LGQRLANKALVHDPFLTGKVAFLLDTFVPIGFQKSHIPDSSGGQKDVFNVAALGQQQTGMQAEIELMLAGVVGEPAATDGQTGLTDTIAGAQGHRKTVEQTHPFQVGIRPEQDRLPQVAEDFPHRLRAAAEAAVFRQVRERTARGGAHLAQPGTLTLDLTEFAHQHNSQHFALGKLLGSGAASFAAQIGTAILLVQESIYHDIDDQE